MTPQQFARLWCANWQGSGSCLGAWLNDNGSIPWCKPAPRCVLPTRCRYFEECVAPTAFKLEGAAGADAQAAWKEYRLHQSTPVGQDVGTARRCACGEPLLPRHRVCRKCQNQQARLKRREKDTK